MSSTEGFTDELRGDTSDQADLETTRRQITLGMDFDIFMESQVGIFLRRRAAAEIAAFRRTFETLEATDTEAIRKLQQEIAVRQVWEEWIRGAIQDGISAQEIAIDRNVV